MESPGELVLSNILGDNCGPNFHRNGEVKDPVLPPLRICSNLFPPASVASPTSSSAFQESHLAASSAFQETHLPAASSSGPSLDPLAASTLPPVESPYAPPILPDQNFVKSEMSAPTHHEYVEYGEDWDAEIDIKDNLLLKGFQRNIDAMVKKEILNVSWVDDDAVLPMEDSLFLRCHQFLKDEAAKTDVEEEFEEKKCDFVKVPRWRPIFQGGSRCKRREEVGRICLRRKQDGGFEIKKEVEEKKMPDADKNHRHLVFGVDDCDFCPACQVQNILKPARYKTCSRNLLEQEPHI